LREPSDDCNSGKTGQPNPAVSTTAIELIHLNAPVFYWRKRAPIRFSRNSKSSRGHLRPSVANGIGLLSPEDQVVHAGGKRSAEWQTWRVLGDLDAILGHVA